MWSHMEQSVNGNSGIAAGDCMGTGEVCLITGGWNPYDVPCSPNGPKVDCDPALKQGHAHERGGLIAFGSDGRFLWVNRGASLWWGAPAIARLLGPDGPAQVIAGNGVFDAATGKTLCPQTNDGGSIGGNGDGTLSAIADIDLDGVPELVTGNQAYKLVKDPASATGYSCQKMFGVGVKMPGGAPCAGGSGWLFAEGFPAMGIFRGNCTVMGLRAGDSQPQVGVRSSGYS